MASHTFLMLRLLKAFVVIHVNLIPPPLFLLPHFPLACSTTSSYQCLTGSSMAHWWYSMMHGRKGQECL